MKKVIPLFFKTTALFYQSLSFHGKNLNPLPLFCKFQKLKPFFIKGGVPTKLYVREYDYAFIVSHLKSRIVLAVLINNLACWVVALAFQILVWMSKKYKKVIFQCGAQSFLCGMLVHICTVYVCESMLGALLKKSLQFWEFKLI